MTALKSAKTAKAPVPRASGIILLAYGYIAVLAPNLKTFDSNGPKFLALALLNLLVFIYLIMRQQKKTSQENFFYFFKSGAGMAYSLLMAVSLLSFVKAINVSESVIHFSKIFTTFTAAWIVSILLYRDLNPVKYLAVGLSILLVYDAITVFSDISNFIRGEVGSIVMIKSVYSNKNILAAALFVKLPFALWLITFEKRWLRIFGLVSLLLGVIAVLFMSARAFYLGLIFLSAAYGIFLVVRHRQTREKAFLLNLASYAAILALAFGIFSGVQHFFYPKKSAGFDQGFATRLSTVTAPDGGGGRLTFWKFSLGLMKENPLLGVGAGNWRVVILEKENPIKADFTYMNKAHNDFIEITTETGIIGGLSFIAIFVVIGWYFIRALFRKKGEEFLKNSFLPAFGLFAYSFDAFFNFPQDRPEIASLFALFAGMGVAVSYPEVIKIKWPVKIPEAVSGNKMLRLIAAGLLLAAMCSATYLLYLNFRSLRVLRILKDEQVSGKSKTTSAFLIREFPAIPNMAAVGDPVINLISNKLIEEQQYEKALTYLRSGNPSPFDSRREFYLSLAFLRMDQSDSALYYIEKAIAQKPLYYIYSKQYCNILEVSGRESEAIALLDTFLLRNKSETEAWKYNAALRYKTGNISGAAGILDSALQYFPSDTSIVKLRDFYILRDQMPYYEDAVKYYNQGDYREAIRYFELCEPGYEAAGGISSYPDLLNSWARSHLNINENASAKAIFSRVVREDLKNYYALMNLGNIAFSEKNYTQAENYFTKCLEARSPDYFLSYSNLGTIYLIQGRADLAIYNYEESLKYGSSATVVGNLYLLWKSKGNQEKMVYYEGLLKGN